MSERLKFSAKLLVVTSIIAFTALLILGQLVVRPALLLLFIHQALAVRFLIRRSKGENAILYNVSTRSDLPEIERDQRDSLAAVLGIVSSLFMLILPVILILADH